MTPKHETYQPWIDAWRTPSILVRVCGVPNRQSGVIDALPTARRQFRAEVRTRTTGRALFPITRHVAGTFQG